MRTRTFSGALVAAAALSLTAAPTASATPPGDNGTVKIHDATTGEELRKNEPKVCSFYLDAFNFDAGQQVDWHIEAWANNDVDKGVAVKSGSLTLDAEGHERTEDMTLPDGQYKLFWNFDGENGRAKHKVFKTDCEDEQPAPSDKPSATPGAPGEQTGTPTAPAQDGSSSPAASEPAAQSPAPSGGASGDLAETGNGAPLGVLGAAAAALVAVGGYLLTRRRTARRH